MVSKELLDYISLELKEGISKENIKKILIKEGWRNETVDLAFKEINNSNNFKAKYFTKKNFIILFIGLTLIISSVILSIGGLNSKMSKKDVKIDDPHTITLTPKLTIEPTTIKPTDEYIGLAGGNCGTEDYFVEMEDNGNKKFRKLECFIEAAKTCTPASLTLNSKVSAYGLSTNSIVDYKISKGESKCILHINQGKISYQIPPGIPESILEPITSSLKKMENTQGVCLFANNENLASIFEKLNNGEFSMQPQRNQNTEFLKGDCSGTYFTAANEVSNAFQ